MAETIYEIGERLCRAYNRQHQNGTCSGCPLAEEHENMECLAATISCLNIKNVEKQLELMREWADEHPAKTYKDVFLEKFPNARISDKDDSPIACRKMVFGGFTAFSDCIDNGDKCKKCWNEPYKEENDE